MEIEEIKNKVQQKLSEKRFKHSIYVMEMCEKLAKRYNINVEMAKKVGIAHDIAKEMKKEELIEYCQKNNIEINEIEIESPGLLHGKVGADICAKDFEFTKQMQQAIEFHTTGSPNMDMLAKILFVADAVSDDRDWADINYLRKLADKNINESIIEILNLVLKDQIEKNKLIHLNGITTRNSLLQQE